MAGQRKHAAVENWATTFYASRCFTKRFWTAIAGCGRKRIEWNSCGLCRESGGRQREGREANSSFVSVDRAWSTVTGFWFWV